MENTNLKIVSYVGTTLFEGSDEQLRFFESIRTGDYIQIIDKSYEVHSKKYVIDFADIPNKDGIGSTRLYLTRLIIKTIE